MDRQVLLQAALEEARLGLREGGLPIGSVLADSQGRIVARGHNLRVQSGDPTAHAEILAIRAAASKIDNYRLTGTTLYATIEPCVMCAGAIVNARVVRLVYGCLNPKAGAVATLYQITTDARLNHRVEVVGGIRADECATVLQAFFAELRRGPAFHD